MSNYISSLNTFYRNSYFHTRMTGLYSQLNKTPYVYGSTAEKANYYNSEGITYLSRIREGAKLLSDSLQELGSLNTFQKMYTFSSNHREVLADSDSEPVEGTRDKEVTVSQVAAGQRNQGGMLESAEQYGGAAGTHTFEIETGGRTTQVTVEVKAGDTNQVVQQRMATAINRSDLGVKAQVVQNAGNGTGALSIEAVETGDNARASFSIRDVSGTLVDDTGADETVRQARNAVYAVDGVERTSMVNKVDLGDGVKVTLLQATSGPVTISTGRNSGNAADKLLAVVQSYNDLLGAAKTNTGGNNRLENDLTSALKSYMPTLEAFGVSMKGDGSLSVDRTKLDAAADDGSLEKHFSYYRNKNFGFIGRLSTITRNVENNPSYYVNKQEEARKSGGLTAGQQVQAMWNSGSFRFPRYYGYENTYALVGMLFNLYI